MAFSPSSVGAIEDGRAPHPTSETVSKIWNLKQTTTGAIALAAILVCFYDMISAYDSLANHRPVGRYPLTINSALWAFRQP